MVRVACLLAVLALAACGSDDEEPAAPAPADATRLRVEITKASRESIQMQLVCDGKCDVERLREVLVAAKPGERACTMQYGGPEQARVTGTVEGRRVDATIDRADGCGIADYDALFAAFGREPPIAR